MEAILIVESVGAWKSFDEIEESLTLDELLFLHKYLMKSKQSHYRMLAAFQGIDMGGDDDFEDSGEDLPEEVLAAERAWQEKKKAAIESKEEIGKEMSEFKLGYSRK
jgi:uncharacterized protein with von Willebrand factor type A (vWA) domain